ncbi:aromatic ring-hydroxylating dioxygenase subunit alpha [Novosphingobium sp.]|uniref:aromatic ring-hydroxylating dioxygenase subunit alpha n=1 Tax=Novosphingobium sp. TaxID=1874826 RepID=UPI0025FEA5E8|nr:aromatic ring-hydroxylating dioxygenase subunit alpha [Novosphingobium sp.]
MYPLNQKQPWPRQQWWIAAWSGEVSRELLGRTILGEPVILYRTEDGTPTALAGVCPHRSYPLAQGTLVGDAVQCTYHGFTFDAAGACVRVPSQASVPDRSRLRHYPTVERGGTVWIWTGDPDRSDAVTIPDVLAMGMAAPGWANDISPMVTIRGRYTLLIDNLMDLSHASFIHADTIPGADYIATIPAELVDGAGSLAVRRVGRIPPNPLTRKQFPLQNGGVEQHFDAEYHAPALIRTGGDIRTEAGEPLGTQNFIHGITPETAHSVHYFVATTRDFAIADPALSAGNLAMGDRIQPQDVAAIEAVEAMLRSLAAAPTEVSCRADTGALKVRHRLARQIASEDMA